MAEQGTQTLTDAQLLALLLDGDERKARELLQQAGGWRKLHDNKSGQMESGHQLTLQLMNEYSRRFLRERMEAGDTLSDPDAVRFYLTQQLRDRQSEVFACVFLDTRHRVICYEELFHGTIDGASIYPREVVKRALHHNAAALILAHNHPSGIAEPSTADERITNRLQQAMALIDVRILDHFVIGETVTSFCELGLL